MKIDKRGLLANETAITAITRFLKTHLDDAPSAEDGAAPEFNVLNVFLLEFPTVRNSYKNLEGPTELHKLFRMSFFT